ncbi:hypothetical protein MBLNU230_g0366t1 [Neophaeotheca triangularis]
MSTNSPEAFHPHGNFAPPPITSQHIDIWEHAALLYCNFEWLDAANTFEYLSRVIPSPRHAMACTLNVGLIQARLGELDSALIRFQQTLHTNAAMAVIYFLIALTEAELGKLPQAEIAYQICLGVLNDEGNSHVALGFDFEITTAKISKNIRAGRESLFTDFLALERIPAEIIFEAPDREPEDSDGDRLWSPDELQEAVQRELRKPLSSQDALHVFQDPPQELVREALEAFVGMQGDQSCSTNTTVVPRNPTARPAAPFKIRNKYIAKGNQQADASSHPLPLSQATQSKKTKLEPRSARVVNESVGELARFINVTYPGMSMRTAQLLLENEPWWAVRSSSTRHASTRVPLAAAFDSDTLGITPRVTRIEPPRLHKRPTSAPASRPPSPIRGQRGQLPRIQSNPFLSALDGTAISCHSSESGSSVGDAQLFRLIEPQSVASQHQSGINGSQQSNPPSPLSSEDDKIVRLTEELHSTVLEGKWSVSEEHLEFLRADTFRSPGPAGDRLSASSVPSSSDHCQPDQNLDGLFFDSAKSSRSASTTTMLDDASLRPPPLNLTPAIHRQAAQQQVSNAEIARPPVSPHHHIRERKPLPPVPTTAPTRPSPPQVTALSQSTGVFGQLSRTKTAPSWSKQPSRLVKQPSPNGSLASLDILGFGKKWRKIRDKRSSKG